MIKIRLNIFKGKDDRVSNKELTGRTPAEGEVPDERRTNDSVLAARLPSGCRAAIARRSSGQFF